MGNLRITLCEDEKLFAKALADEIRAFFSERKIHILANIKKGIDLPVFLC